MPGIRYRPNSQKITIGRTLPEGEIFISNFVPKYLQYFGWECKLSNYGFKKLVKLLAAIPDTVTVVEDENHEKVVRLTNSAKLSNINEAHLKVDAVDVDVKDENDAKTEPEAAHINDMDQSNATSYQKRERAIQIVNPNTGKEVKLVDPGATATESRASASSKKEVIAIDCEMVWVSQDGKKRILARVSLVNKSGDCIYDKFVKPTKKVVDYMTPWSGIRPADIENGEDFRVVQHEVAEYLRGRVLVGHSLKHDLRALFLDQPMHDQFDTALHPPFLAGFGDKTPSLKYLAEQFLGLNVQEGEHSSIEDARAAMKLHNIAMGES